VNGYEKTSMKDEVDNMADPFRLRYDAPLIHPEAWVAPNATLTAHVELGKNASVWFGAVLRGDVEPITIGEGSNIQDLCCLHADPGFPCTIGERVTVGHRAIIHGAVIEDEVLVGMGAIILNGARIGSHSIVGAGALISEGKVIPPRSLVVGVPAKITRQVTEEEVAKLIRSAQRYVEAAQHYRIHWRSV
jgi:carbonic anhydrase/acetyltransferase-like protein (isoleucine patch superfamily)